MAEDIKSTLYAALGRKKLGVPQYSVQEEKRGGRSRFKCELRVPGMNYTGLGASTSKKDAMTNAARDFGLFLIREGRLQPHELPQLTEVNLEGSNEPLWGSEPQQSSPYVQSNSNNMDRGTVEPKIGEMVSRMNFIKREKTEHEQYLDEKAAEVAKSEEVDMQASIHGGWTMENCKKGLNEYCQKIKTPVPVYEIRQTGSIGTSNFVAEFTLHTGGKSIHGRGEGSTKKVAETTCALSIIRQLYHWKFVGVATPGSSKKKANNLPAIEVKLDQNIVTRIENYLKNVGIEPAQNLQFSASDAPRSLIIDQKLDKFEESEESISYPISWSPPSVNWNPWRGSNIDEAPLAYMKLDQISQKLLDEENSKDILTSIRNVRENLPVFQIRNKIISTVERNSVVLIKGATGCGKSTQVCQYLLEDYLFSGKGANFNCFVSQPRRISAITLAERVAEERFEKVGNSVGYGVRFDSMTPRPFGAIMFVTVGVLLRKLEMGLRGVSHVIIDEIHERDINTDFLLIIVKELVQNNPGLKVILMSATIDTTMFSEYFNTNVLIEMPEHANEVEFFFLEDAINFLQYVPPIDPKAVKKKKKKPGNGTEGENEEIGTCDDSVSTFGDIEPSYPPEVRNVLSKMNEAEIPLDLIEYLLSDIQEKGAEGAVLVFLPGWNIISMMLARLESHPVFGNPNVCVVLPLHSQLTSKEQHRVFDIYPKNVRKIILATNIAETSITINDVVFVIDSCRAREKLYSTRNNMTHFATVWASKNSIIQRRGRAGRVRKGFCFHLCTKKRFSMLEEHSTPEMLRTPLYETSLMIKLLRLGPVYEFLEKAIQSPPLDNIVEAELVLKEINAFDSNNELTPLGKILARLPISPVIGKIIILGATLGLGNMMTTIAAGMSFNFPYIQKEKFHSKLSYQHRKFSGKYLSDHIGLLAVNQNFKEQLNFSQNFGIGYCNQNYLNFTTLVMSNDARKQLCEVLVNCGFSEELFIENNFDTNRGDDCLPLFLSLITSACYPNVGYVRQKRAIFTLEGATALLNKMSVCVAFDNNHPVEFNSPIVMFTEKLRTNCITCHQISNITPLQLLLFGSKRVEATSTEEVVLDDMIPLKMSAQVAASIVALRPCIEACVIRACKNPSELNNRTRQEMEFIELLKILSSEEAWNGSVIQPKSTTNPTSNNQNYPTTRFYGSGPMRDYTVRPQFRPHLPYSRGPGSGFKPQRHNAPYGANSWGPRDFGWSGNRPGFQSNFATPGMNQRYPSFGHEQDFTTDMPYQRSSESMHSNTPYQRDPV